MEKNCYTSVEFLLKSCLQGAETSWEKRWHNKGTFYLTYLTDRIAGLN